VTSLVRHAALSHVGRQRAGNEDAYVARPPLYAVADGMGGARAGEVAARMAVATLTELLAPLPSEAETPTAAEAAERLAAAVAEANARIFSAAANDAARSGMGTTLTALLLLDDTALIAHVGDSRVYLLRGGELSQVTDDHSLVAEMVREGRLAADEARLHPYRSVLSRALGTEPQVEIDELRIEVRPGDVLLLCSDGLSGPVPADEIQKALAVADPHKAARRLIDEALHHGGPDNITAVVVQVLAESTASEAAEEPGAGTDRDAGAPPLADDGGAEASQPSDDPPRRRRWFWLRPAAATTHGAAAGWQRRALESFGCSGAVG
jgi:protein phosphatase